MTAETSNLYGYSSVSSVVITTLTHVHSCAGGPGSLSKPGAESHGMENLGTEFHSLELQ